MRSSHKARYYQSFSGYNAENWLLYINLVAGDIAGLIFYCNQNTKFSNMHHFFFVFRLLSGTISFQFIFIVYFNLNTEFHAFQTH